MSVLKQRTYDFLRSIDMHPEQTVIEKTADDIISEMNRGLCGEESSIAMIPTFISASAEARDNEPVIVVDAGGTNFRIGLCEFEKGRPIFSDVNKSKIPGSTAEIDADEFFNKIADKILPYTAKSSRIGFCFSYPAEILPNHDGKILALNKELRVNNAWGSLIGSSLKKKLSAKGVKNNPSFVVLNDTTSALLGGIANLGLDDSGGIAGLVLGTGFNTSYVEKGANILKLKNAEDMIINCESGNFSGAFRGKADFMTDRSSEIPYDHLLEKMLGGAYMGSLITNTVKLASKEGLISKNFDTTPIAFTAPDMDEFMRGKKNRLALMCTHKDSAVLQNIIDAAYERAARLVCANIASLCLQADGGKSERKPFCVIAEGSSFYNSLLFYDKLKRLTNEFIEEKMRRYIEFFHTENLTLSGAALSVFTAQK